MYIPQETLERGQQEAEAGVTGQFALASAQDQAAKDRMEREFDLNKALSIYNAEQQGAIQRRLAKAQLPGQLLGAGLGAAGSLGAGLLAS